MALKDFIPAIPFVGGIVDAALKGGQNRKSRRFSREMYARQKQDSLDFWHMQNTYNSPEQQMARLKEAGLNPNLVYGSGADATSSSAPKVPSPMSAEFGIPSLNTGSIADVYFRGKMMNKQLDQLEANIIKTYAEAEAIGYDNTVVGTTVDAAIRKRNAETLQAESQAEITTMARNVQQDMLRHDIPLQKALLGVLYDRLKNTKVQADIDAVKAQIEKVKTDTELSRMDVEVRQVLEGLPAGDAIRVLTSLLQVVFRK